METKEPSDTGTIRRPRGRYGKRNPEGHPIDIHVGLRVRLRRTLLGLSQEALGLRIGVTFQQVQKYERGSNRISSSRLWELGQVLDCPISFFFDDMPDAAAPRPSPDDPLLRRETLELVRSYYRIPPDVRERLFSLVKGIAGPTEAE